MSIKEQLTHLDLKQHDEKMFRFTQIKAEGTGNFASNTVCNPAFHFRRSITKAIRKYNLV